MVAAGLTVVLISCCAVVVNTWIKALRSFRPQPPVSSIRLTSIPKGANFDQGEAAMCTSVGEDGHYNDAIPHCRAAIGLNPEAKDYNNLGWYLALDGRGAEAIEACKQAVRMQPAAIYYDSLAMAYAVAGNGKMAMAIEQGKVMPTRQVSTLDEDVTLGMSDFAVGRKADAKAAWELARNGTDASARRIATEFERKYR